MLDLEPIYSRQSYHSIWPPTCATARLNYVWVEIVCNAGIVNLGGTGTDDDLLAVWKLLLVAYCLYCTSLLPAAAAVVSSQSQKLFVKGADDAATLVSAASLGEGSVEQDGAEGAEGVGEGAMWYSLAWAVQSGLRTRLLVRQLQPAWRDMLEAPKLVQVWRSCTCMAKKPILEKWRFRWPPELATRGMMKESKKTKGTG